MSDDLGAIDEAPPRPRRPRTGAVAVLVVALVAIGSGATWLVLRGTGGSSAADGGVCPTSMPNASPDLDSEGPSFDDLVPADPTVADLDGHLVPRGDPTQVVLCEYVVPYKNGITDGGVSSSDGPFYDGTAGPYTSGGPPAPAPDETGRVTELPLGRSAAHASNDASVARLLAAVQSATVESEDGYYTCATTSLPVPQYRIRLTYDTGVVWLAGPASCAVTNGTSWAVTDLSEPFWWALNNTAADTVPGTPTPLPPSAAPTGTLGSNAPPSTPTGSPTLPTTTPAADPSATCNRDGGLILTEDTAEVVPFAPVSVDICLIPADPSAATTTTAQSADVAQEIADEVTRLASTPATPGTAQPSCPADAGDRWDLTFRSADDLTATVVVHSAGCRQVTGGGWTGSVSSTLLDLLRQYDGD